MADREAIKELPYETIVQKIKGSTCTAGKEVVAVQRLHSGDLRLFTSTTRARDALRDDPTWITALGIMAAPTTKHYSVLVHNVRVNTTDTTNKDTIKAIQEQNASRIPGLTVQKIAWLRRKLPKDKTHAAIVLSTPSASLANKVIQEGLLINYALHTAVIFNSAFAVTQCFKCHALGNVAVHCQAEEKCGKRAGKHATASCLSQNGPKCANCGRAHPAWSNLCPFKKTQQDKAALARATVPQRHHERLPSPPQGEEWITVEPPRKRKQLVPRGPGRPRAFDKPNSPRQQTLAMGRTAFSQPPNPRPTTPSQPDTNMDSE